PACDDLDELVGLQGPVRRASRAFPDADLLVAVLPQGQPARGHLVAGGLLEWPPVLKLGGLRRGEIRRRRVGVSHRRSFLVRLLGQDCEACSGKGRAIGSVARRLLPCSSNRSSPKSVVSTTVD